MGVPIDITFTGFAVPFSASSACSAPGLLPFVLPQGSLSVLGDLRGEIRAVIVSVPIDITFTGFAHAASLQSPAGQLRGVQPEGLKRNSPRHRRGYPNAFPFFFLHSLSVKP